MLPAKQLLGKYLISLVCSTPSAVVEMRWAASKTEHTFATVYFDSPLTVRCGLLPLHGNASGCCFCRFHDYVNCAIGPDSRATVQVGNASLPFDRHFDVSGTCISSVRERAEMS